MSQFKGAWIPAELCRRKDLIPTEKLILGYCASFPNRCFASDAHIAAELGMTEKTVSNTLSRLRSKGLLTGRDFPKSFTTLPVNGNRVPVNGHIEQSKEISIEQREEFPNTGIVVKRDLESVEVVEMSEEDIAWIRKQCGESDWKHLSANVRVLSPNCSAAAVG